MTNVMPSFKLHTTVTDAQVEEMSSKKFLEAGRHTLEILDIEYKGTTQKDASWLRFSLTLGKSGTVRGADGKFKGVIYSNVMVPTADILYDGRINVFTMLQSFFAGLGESLTTSNLQRIADIFGKPDQLKGLTVDVDVGYSKSYIAYANETYTLVDRSGKPLVIADGTENSFTSRALAESAALVNDIQIQKFMDVLKYHKADEPKLKPVKLAPKKKASFDDE